jgi:spore coat polysaccharide biosynthesis predicted glycosyltransferase SpsG
MRVAIRCDAGPEVGVGHLIRCVALAEELVRRGGQVTFLADTGGVPWAEEQLTGRGLAREPAPTAPAELVARAAARRLDAVLLDSYHLDPRYAAAVRDAGYLVAAVVDGPAGARVADIFIDQNLDAEHRAVELPPGAIRLAGVRYALLRDRVRALRPARPGGSRAGRRPHVVCFFGGTDACGAAPPLTRLLVRTGVPCRVTVVAGSPALRAELAGIRPAGGQSIDIIDPTDALPELCAAADLAVSAAGTSTWELLCLGTPAALVEVAENQRIGYEPVVARGLAAGLGRLDRLRHGGAAPEATLRRLLTSPDERRSIGDRAWAAVDGRGRERVVDQLASTLDRRHRPPVRDGR